MASEMSEGAATFIVKDDELNKLKDEAPFMIWLNENGFQAWSHSKGWYDSVSWIYVNIDTKLYARGMPGISVCSYAGGHAITVDEFMTIYNIFKKYEGLPVLRMSIEEHEAFEKAKEESKKRHRQYWDNITFDEWYNEVIFELKAEYNCTDDEIEKLVKIDELKRDFEAEEDAGYVAYLLRF